MVDLINTIVYAGRLKDRFTLLSSSSGGAFTALSDFFLEKGNAVVATVYNYENHTAEFQMILDKKQRDRAKGCTAFLCQWQRKWKLVQIMLAVIRLE